MATRVLVCGSRTFTDRDLLWSTLDQVAADADEHLVIIHGCARGADTMASEWARDRGHSEERFPADWAQYGKRAGFVRNSEMLRRGMPHRVFAFVDKQLSESRGTAMMVNLATKARVPTIVISPHRWSDESDSTEQVAAPLLTDGDANQDVLPLTTRDTGSGTEGPTQL